MNLDEFQRRALETDGNAGKGRDGEMARILGLASEAGAILEVYKRFLRDNVREEDVRPIVSQELGDVMWFCATIASANGLSLSTVAQDNLTRAHNRYGRLNLQTAPEFEQGFGIEQRFPRRLVVSFGES